MRLNLHKLFGTHYLGVSYNMCNFQLYHKKYCRPSHTMQDRSDAFGLTFPPYWAQSH